MDDKITTHRGYLSTSGTIVAWALQEMRVTLARCCVRSPYRGLCGAESGNEDCFPGVRIVPDLRIQVAIRIVGYY